MNTIQATVLVQSSSNLLRMIIFTISQSGLYMDHIGSKTRSLGQIASKPLSPLRGHSFASVFMKLYQSLCLDDILVKFKYGSCRIKKSGSLGQIVLKPCSPSRGHSFASIFMKLYQNVCLDNISVKFDHGWDGSKK